MNEEKNNLFRCPLCGNSFPKEDPVCRGCFLGKSCGLICCPRCHYQFVDESRMLRFLKRIFGEGKGEKEAGR